MAKAPAWKKLIRTKEQMGLTRTKAPGKSPRDKMLEAVDKQIANISGGTLGARAVWYRAAGDKGYKVNPRYGSAALSLHDEDIYVEANQLEAFLKALREDIAAGNMDKQLQEISDRMSASKRAGKKAA